MARNQNKRELAAVAWVLDADRYNTLGQEMAQAAVNQVGTAGTLWDRCRTLFVEAQDHKKADEALGMLFAPGEKVKGKKAPWFRTYKSVLSSANTLHITVTNAMGLTALQKAIKLAKEQAIENDPEAQELKSNQLLGMFEKIAQGCLNRGIAKTRLATILKGLEA